MNLGEPATPCGLVAKSFFNDHFSNFKRVNADSSTKDIKINDKGIAWETDRLYKFGNVKYAEFKDKLIQEPPEAKTPLTDLTPGNEWKNVQWIDMTNEHFIVWMRYAGLPTFRKLWGKVDEDLTPG
jgi:hypothetical protein